MRPWIQEDDIIQVEEGNVSKYYVVERVEDLVYDWNRDAAEYGTVATVTQGDFKRVENLEPKDTKIPERQLYQVRAGIDIGMCYVEILAGAARRGTFKVPKPSSTNYYVGHFDEVTSPYLYPTYEFYLLYNEVPAFSIYNSWGFTITPYFAFRGKKIKMYDLEDKDTPKYIQLGPAEIADLLKKVKLGIVKHRRITKRGIEEG